MLGTPTFKVACLKNRVRTESTEYTKEGLLGALGKNQKHAELKFGVPKGFPRIAVPLPRRSGTP